MADAKYQVRKIIIFKWGCYNTDPDITWTTVELRGKLYHTNGKVTGRKNVRKCRGKFRPVGRDGNKSLFTTLLALIWFTCFRRYLITFLKSVRCRTKHYSRLALVLTMTPRDVGGANRSHRASRDAGADVIALLGSLKRRSDASNKILETGRRACGAEVNLGKWCGPIRRHKHFGLVWTLSICLDLFVRISVPGSTLGKKIVIVTGNV